MTQTSSPSGTATTPAEMSPAEKQYPLAPSLVDAQTYRDPARYRREVEDVLLEAWYPVYPSADLAAARDYAVWEQLGQSVVVTRLDDRSVAAFHNVCQHRGARLVDGVGNCPTGKFRCPWHGFVYDLRGAVGAVPLRGSFDETELAGLRSPAVRVVEWGSWIWMTLSDSTPDLRTYLGEIGEELSGYGLESYTTVYRQTAVLKANWKIVVDAFNETWHVPFTHPDTLGGVVRWREAALKITSPHSWMTLPVRGLTDKVESTDHRRNHICHYLVFPNTIFSCFPTHLQMWSAWPVSPDETVLCAYQLNGPTPEGMTEGGERDRLPHRPRRVVRDGPDDRDRRWPHDRRRELITTAAAGSRSAGSRPARATRRGPSTRSSSGGSGTPPPVRPRRSRG